jgi:hypothetical protein
VIAALTDEPRAKELTRVAREVLATEYSDEARAESYRQLLAIIGSSGPRAGARAAV